MSRTVTLALDWSLNTNHTGFVVAEALEFYKKVGLRLKLLPYADHPTAAKRVRVENAQVGLGPQETVVAYADSPTPILALAAVNAHNPSALAVLEGSAVTRPRELDGKRYASYGARFEMHVVRQMVRADGGEGSVEERVLPKPTVPDALFTGEADSTWVFPAWEGAEAELRGRPLRHFLLRDYGIPDLYTPVLFTTLKFARKEPALLRAFMRATARGFELAAAEPERAAELLLAAYPELDAKLVRRSQPLASPNYHDADRPWGVIDSEVWAGYGRYLYEHGFVTSRGGETVAEPDWNAMHTADF
ncbi:MAG: Hydroxymethylpyrimidine ABC transporter, substrate-binding component [uncultured Truepera sp.]|uniref:Thiamine pyrimidine synthase n=1 Tax=uncultured Truepera sp. TaxID=543023 RepID=A0A6J4V8V2_9DEIN|nr:MAG: Hydroxymethylpyrimidine ABC transporter, substrate-binding component [uncultured Truepera sp.]